MKGSKQVTLCSVLGATLLHRNLKLLSRLAGALPATPVACRQQLNINDSQICCTTWRGWRSLGDGCQRFQALGLPFETVFVAEKMVGARAALTTLTNGKANHTFHDVSCLVDGDFPKCQSHGDMCCGLSPDNVKLDLVTAGPPCQPFTNRRVKSGKGRSGSVREHPDVWLTMDFIPAFIAKWRPRGLILEQVKPFCRTDPEDGSGDSWCTTLQKSLAKLGYDSEFFNLDLETWVECVRGRCSW